ncbi:MAG: rhomboid family intramembrane serine protease [Lachnospiraceae bacterium]|nr:rhomboid family intramembrane serine protease [Lachnospiraceae bacterium]
MNTEQFLISRGYLRLDTSAPTVSVMYRISGSIVYCLLILNTSLDEFSVPQYTHIREQVVNSFGSRGYSDIRLHTLIVTSRQNSGREIAAMDGGAWILDGTSGRVILYENTVSDFDGLREGLEGAWTKDFAASVARAYSGTMERAGRSPGQAGFFVGIKAFFENNEITVALVLINLIVFIGLSIFGSTTDASYMARHGAMYSSYLVTNREYYRLFTCMFMHFGFVHLASNMLALILIGGQVEDILGKPKFMFLYMFSGLFASFVSFITSFYTSSGVVSAGASGAIFGLIGCLFAIVIKNRGKYRDLTTGRIAFLVAYSLYSGFTGGGVDNAAHIGGLIMGLIIGAIIYRAEKVEGGEHFNRIV